MKGLTNTLMSQIICLQKEHVDVTLFLVYLNDNDGLTYFPEQDLTIEPRCGRILVFPPTWEYPHQGLAPTTTKYILSTYIHYE